MSYTMTSTCIDQCKGSSYWKTTRVGSGRGRVLAPLTPLGDLPCVLLAAFVLWLILLFLGCPLLLSL